MTIGTVLLAAGMLVVAILVLMVNDKSKPEPAGKKQASRSPGSTLGLFLGFLVAGATIGASIAVRYIPAFGPIVALAIFGLVVLFVAISLRKLIWALLRMVLSGQLPRVIIPNADGKLEMKCPSCSGQLVFPPPSEVGDNSFVCPHCGESGAWSSIANGS